MKKVFLFALVNTALLFNACSDSSSSASEDEPLSSESVFLSSAQNQEQSSSGVSPLSSSESVSTSSNSNKDDSSSSDSASVTQSSDSSTPESSSSTNEIRPPEGSFTDNRDGKTYKLTKIGTQTWMAENLHFADSLIYSAYDAQNICPQGFHLPSVEEFQTLIDFVGGETIAAKMLKSSTAWPIGEHGDWNGVDQFGFNAIPVDSGKGTGTDENYWTTTRELYNSSTFMMMKINPYPTSIYPCSMRNVGDLRSRDITCFINGEPDTSLSVRCLSNIIECGSTTFNTNTHFCENNSAYPLCRGRDYDATKFICKDNQLYDMATDSLYKFSWVWLNPEKEYGLMQDPRDGQYYKTITIDTVTWMAENLNYALEGSLCYNNDSMYCDLYGRLYSEEQATLGDSIRLDALIQGVCPDGWRLPTRKEYDNVIDRDPYKNVFSTYIDFEKQEQFKTHQNYTGLSLVLGGYFDSRETERRFQWGSLNSDGGFFGSDFTENIRYYYYPFSGYVSDGYFESVRCVKNSK
ncbi:MAG: hypothetical protein HUK21_10865 [Fibrobacteraceae bacterium]|nr:hypothetical protein [Fibrobacteraceae bacterium]